jgi:hypothetical protein
MAFSNAHGIARTPVSVRRRSFAHNHGYGIESVEFSTAAQHTLAKAGLSDGEDSAMATPEQFAARWTT